MSDLKKQGSSILFIAFAAIVIAAAPSFFFPTPLFMKSAGNMNGFYGIAIWPAAVLAGTAFMLSVDFTKRRTDPWSKNTNLHAIVAILGLGLIVVGYSYAFAGNYPVVTKSRPSFLVPALFMFAGLRGLEALFIHGILQADVLIAPSAHPQSIGLQKSGILRVFYTFCFSAILSVGFFYNADGTTSLYCGALIVETLFGAVLFELGLPLYSVVLTRALCGGIFIWFTQMFLF